MAHRISINNNGQQKFTKTPEKKNSQIFFFFSCSLFEHQFGGLGGKHKTSSSCFLKEPHCVVVSFITILCLCCFFLVLFLASSSTTKLCTRRWKASKASEKERKKKIIFSYLIKLNYQVVLVVLFKLLFSSCVVFSSHVI